VSFPLVVFTLCSRLRLLLTLVGSSIAFGSCIHTALHVLCILPGPVVFCHSYSGVQGLPFLLLHTFLFSSSSFDLHE
jgi:hypothetical protein